MTGNNRSDKLLRSALWYGQKMGWYVIPLRDGDKIPRICDWQENASNEPDQIRQWWAKWPQANVGIAAGKSGLLCLDLDTYKDDYQGASVITRADEETVTSLTGSGGTHLLYQMPAGAAYTNARGQLPEGIDVRGWGGQFVAPPSIHPNGTPYQWEVGYGPHEITVLPLPPGLDDLLAAAHSRLESATVTFTDAELPAPPIHRWHLTDKILGLIQNGAEMGTRSESDQAVITALVSVGATDDQIRAIFDSYSIGTQGKYAQKGAHALRYLATSIARARQYVQLKRKDEMAQRARAFMQMAAVG
jgi:hypothetical protein